MCQPIRVEYYKYQPIRIKYCKYQPIRIKSCKFQPIIVEYSPDMFSIIPRILRPTFLQNVISLLTSPIATAWYQPIRDEFCFISTNQKQPLTWGVVTITAPSTTADTPVSFSASITASTNQRLVCCVLTNQKWVFTCYVFITCARGSVNDQQVSEIYVNMRFTQFRPWLLSLHPRDYY